MRPDIPIGDEEYESVREYAKREGLSIPAAWAEIVTAGIEAVTDDDADNIAHNDA